MDTSDVTFGGVSPVFTLSEEQLEKIAGFLYTKFQPNIAQVAKYSFQSQILELVTTIVNGVLAGLNKKNLRTLKREVMTSRKKMQICQKKTVSFRSV